MNLYNARVSIAESIFVQTPITFVEAFELVELYIPISKTETELRSYVINHIERNLSTNQIRGLLNEGQKKRMGKV